MTCFVPRPIDPDTWNDLLDTDYSGVDPNDIDFNNLTDTEVAAIGESARS